MPDAVADLFAEFAAAYARGERPEARAYLERAGADADELALLIERFLRGVPAPRATPEESALLASWLHDDPPLLELRRRKGLRVDEVVERLAVALDIEPSRRARLKRQYQRLEGGVLDPAGVAEQVWSALAATLGEGAERLARAWRPPEAAAGAFLRADAPLGAASAPPPPEEEPDREIDRLFTGRG